MPLEQTITFESGLSINSAYFVIKELNFKYKDNNSIEIVVGIFVTDKAYTDGNPEIDIFKHICSGSNYKTYFGETILNAVNKNPLDQAYVYLMTLNEYTDAILT